MHGPYLRAAVTAAVKRAWRDQRAVDIDYLSRWTGARPSYISLLMEQTARRIFNDTVRPRP